MHRPYLLEKLYLITIFNKVLKTRWKAVVPLVVVIPNLHDKLLNFSSNSLHMNPVNRKLSKQSLIYFLAHLFLCQNWNFSAYKF